MSGELQFDWIWKMATQKFLPVERRASRVQRKGKKEIQARVRDMYLRIIKHSVYTLKRRSAARNGIELVKKRI